MNIKIELVPFETSVRHFYVKFHGEYVGTMSVEDFPDTVRTAFMEAA